jgi:hypothetical protein
MKLGRYKFYWERLKGYLAVGSMFLAWRMNVLIKPFAWYWYPICFIGALIIIYLDAKFIVSDENSMGLIKNKEFQEMKETLKRIEGKLK